MPYHNSLNRCQCELMHCQTEYDGGDAFNSQLPPLMCVWAQVPWGMVTGPDGNLYIAMDDEYEVPPLTITGPCIAQMCRACTGRMRLQPLACTF